MKTARNFALVLVTVPNVAVARRLARGILQEHLAACVNIVPRLESHYWWQDKLERSAELLLLIKTRRRLLKALEQLVLKLHPYDTPEFLVIPVVDGSDDYLAWVETAVGPRKES